MNSLGVTSRKPSVAFFSSVEGDFTELSAELNVDKYQVIEISDLIELKKVAHDKSCNLSALVFSTAQGVEEAEKIIEQLDLNYMEIGGPVIAAVREEEQQNEEALLNLGVTKVFQRRLGIEALNLVLSIEIDEFERICKLREELQRRASAIGQIVDGTFRFKTRREAQNLATMLSLTCPNPMPIAIGLTELLINSVEHGCLGIGHDEKGALIEQGTLADEIDRRRASPEYCDKCVVVKFERKQNCLIFDVSDDGDGFDYKSYIAADKGHLKKHGRGIMMAKGCFEELEYFGNGNRVRAVHRFGY